MSRLSVFLAVAGVALCARPVNFRSPLTIDEKGGFYSQILESPTGNGSRSRRLFVKSRTNDGLWEWPPQVGFRIIPNPHQAYSVNITLPGVIGGRRSFAQGHDLLQESNAVAVIRKSVTTGELIIGATREQFRENCRPDTFITFDRAAALFSDVQVYIYPAIPCSIDYGYYAKFADTYPNIANNVPSGVYERIRRYLLSNGARSLPDVRNAFSECPESLISAGVIPNIEIRFASGSISYSPELYIDFNREDETCTLRIGEGIEGGTIFEIDPLMLVGKNIAVTSSNEWVICDSLALSARPVNFRSPLRYGSNGGLISNIFVSSTSGQSIPVRLDVGRDFAISERLIHHHSSSAIVDFLMTGDPYQSFPLVAPSPSALRDLISSHIGIGPSSFITREVGSVAVIRNGSHPELILRSTAEHFRTSCIPGSLMLFNANRHLSAATTLRSSNMEASFGTHEIRFKKSHSLRAYVSGSMFEGIMELLPRLGILPDELVPNYFHCTQAAIATLPNIEFTFSTGISLVVLPEDYVDFDATDNSCKLRVGAAPIGQYLIIDPLMLVDTNVRISRDNVWEFCDSAATFSAS